MTVFKQRCLFLPVPCVQKTCARKTTLLAMFWILIVFVLLVYMDETKLDYTNVLQDKGALLKTALQDALTADFLGNTDCEQSLPDCIIIGAANAGIKTFSSFLGLHPQAAIQFGNSATSFFSSDQYEKGLGWYRQRMMCSTGRQVTIATSPHYFSSPSAPKRIYAMNHDIKLILLVRDPIVRALFHFLQKQSANPAEMTSQTFETSVFNSATNTVITESPYVQQSMYSISLQRWLQYFRLKQILILDGDTLETNPIRSLKKAERFLRIDHIFNHERLYFNKEKGIYCLEMNSTVTEDSQMSCFSKDEKPLEQPQLQQEVYSALQQYFRPFNEVFQSITRTDTKW